MRFISCASYYGSGSSAITDLLSEYDSIFSFTDEEFRFLQDPDGIATLEWNLVHHFDRHNSGHALKRYKRLVDLYCGNIFGKKYEAFFHGNWRKYSYQYINDLTDFTYKGWWNWDIYDRGDFYFFRKRILNKILHETIWRNQPERTLNTMKNEITYCSHPTEEKFLSITKNYIEQLFSSVCNGTKTVMVDQIVSPTNLQFFIRYFDDIKVFVVDRDPRDIYVLEKYVWKDGIIPTEVETFCKWFEYTREHRKVDNLNTDCVHYIQFEDLIYHYNETNALIEKWLGLEKKKHTKKGLYFDPAKSIHNTQTWKRYHCNMDDINYIENKLNDYLYDFSAKI